MCLNLLVPVLLHECVNPPPENDADAQRDGVVEKPSAILGAFKEGVALQCKKSGGTGVHRADLYEGMLAGIGFELQWEAGIGW